MVAIIALGKLGVSVTPFVAAIGAMSLGAGLAMQGLLSNYGAGLNIIIARPFVVGDTINVQGVGGQVKEVHFAFTLLTNEDDVEITISNKHIVGEIIHNSHADTIAEETVGIAYDTDKAVSVIEDALSRIEKISTARKPLVGIEDFADSALILVYVFGFQQNITMKLAMRRMLKFYLHYKKQILRFHSRKEKSAY